MEVAGLGEKGILIISDFPTRTDDHLGTVLSGESGTLLKSEFSKHGINLANDCWRTSIARCRAFTDRGLPREPTAKEIELCKPNIQKIIKELSPKKVIILGNSMTIKAIYSKRIKRMSADVCRGIRFIDINWDCYVYHFYHPKQIIQDERNYLLRSVWNRDIEFALSDSTIMPDNTAPRVAAELLGKKYDGIDHTKVHILTTAKEIITALRILLKSKGVIAFDYEATNIKPYQKDQKLLSVSYTTQDLQTYTFPIQHKALPPQDQKRVLRMWARVIADPKVFKVVAGYAMEYSWSKWFCNCTPKGFIWDTQLCSHILDNRKGVTGLKFQLFQMFGIEEYDKDAKKYIKSADGSSCNRMEEMPLSKMLKYNGIDSYGTMMIFQEQRTRMQGTANEGIRRAYKFFMKSTLSLTKAHMNGLTIDEEYYKIAQEDLAVQIAELDGKLVKHFEQHKAETGQALSYTSADDLKAYFFGFCGIEPTKYTKKGNASMDADTLAGIGTELSDMIVRHRKLEKMKTTYLSNILLESHDSVMRPLFPLNLVKSYRSSSQKINFQNLPNRDPEAKTTIRTGIKPAPECYLSAIDMSGAEVFTSLAYHKDPIFERFLADPDSDMHRHVSAKVFLLEEDQVAANKMIRKMCKAMTFGWFYGDWYKSLAATAWEFSIKLDVDGVPMREHMASAGIGNLDLFTKHMGTVEDYFWGPEMFGVYTQWKKDIVKLYKKQGYIDTYLGFRFTDKMDDKQVTNYPIQSTSFHMLLDILNHVTSALEHYKMKTKICGQIHDEVVANVHYTELIQYHEIFDAAVARVNAKYDWIVLPFEVEAQISKKHEDGGSMAEVFEVNMNDVKALDASLITLDDLAVLSKAKYTSADLLSGVVNMDMVRDLAA